MVPGIGALSHIAMVVSDEDETVAQVKDASSKTA